MPAKRGTKQPTKKQGTGRARYLYVKSLNELTDEEAFFVREIQTVRRRPRKNAPLQNMVKVTLYSERQTQKMVRLREEILRMEEKLRKLGIDPFAASVSTKLGKIRGT